MTKLKIGRKPLLGFLLILSFSCSRSNDNEPPTVNESKPEIIIKRRDDGTLSSINQVENGGIVNGIRTTFYRDGKTIYSKLTFKHGIKHGTCIRYYKNGQIFEHASYSDGKKDGLSRKYYKDGKLLSECGYEKGNPKPGLKEYKKDGTLISTYPEVNFTEVDYLEIRTGLTSIYPAQRRARGSNSICLNAKEKRQAGSIL